MKKEKLKHALGLAKIIKVRTYIFKRRLNRFIDHKRMHSRVSEQFDCGIYAIFDPTTVNFVYKSKDEKTKTLRSFVLPR